MWSRTAGHTRNHCRPLWCGGCAAPSLSTPLHKIRRSSSFPFFHLTCAAFLAFQRRCTHPEAAAARCAGRATCFWAARYRVPPVLRGIATRFAWKHTDICGKKRRKMKKLLAHCSHKPLLFSTFSDGCNSILRNSPAKGARRLLPLGRRCHHRRCGKSARHVHFAP